MFCSRHITKTAGVLEVLMKNIICLVFSQCLRIEEYYSLFYFRKRERESSFSCMWYLRFSRLCTLRTLSSGMWLQVLTLKQNTLFSSKYESTHQGSRNWQLPSIAIKSLRFPTSQFIYPLTSQKREALYILLTHTEVFTFSLLDPWLKLTKITAHATAG